MTTNGVWARAAGVAAAACWLGLGMGCDSGGGGGGSSAPDVGDNDIGVVLCVGDSITEGRAAPAGAPYPSRLDGLSGKRVINAGVAGERSFETINRVPGLLARHKPGYMCLLIGANDAIYGYGTAGVGENVRSMIRMAKEQKTVPLIATELPAYGSHAYISQKLRDISAYIRQVVKEEGGRLVDLEKEFGSDRSLLQPDGLHPSDSGTQLIALSFNDKL